jgi:alpha-galactosidase
MSPTMPSLSHPQAAAGTTAESARPRPAAPTGIERDPVAAAVPAAPGVGQRVTIRDQHLRLLQVTLRDQTDVHNELVQVNEWLLHPSEKLELQGNVFVVENTLTGAGRVLLKLAPLPHARPGPGAVDLRVAPRDDSGFDFTLYRAADEGEFVDLPFVGGVAGRTRALQQFQRSRAQTAPEHRLPRFLSNTWGDRSRDSRIRAEFIEKEIAAGARLGVEVVQIDDGWQKGITQNSARSGGQGLWQGFWAARPDFWEPDPVKFPGGLQPLARQAAAHGLALGLWFAPDSVNDFANWEKDAACLTAFFRQHGIAHFKIDGVHAPNARAHVNLNRFFAAVLRDTGGRVVFDLDVTAQLRPGYFGLIGTGPLFVENRYTDWHRYWPHQTLRNLWQLAWWVDPNRLRMEFLNQARNREKYADDPLAPARYAPDALFATVFFSNPLGWFEVSNLPDDYFERLPALVATWKQCRAELFGGTIFPLGQAPDGSAWTGFAAVADDGKSALALVFRELNPSAAGSLALPGFHAGNSARCDVLAGHGSAAWTGDVLHISDAAPLGYTLVRITG